MGTDEEAKAIVRFFAVIEEGRGFGQGFGVGIDLFADASEPLEGIAFVRTDVRFSEQSNPIAKRFQVMNHTLGASHRFRMVGQCAGAPWGTTTVEFLPEGGAHGHRAVGPVKTGPVLGQTVDIRCLAFLAPVGAPSVPAHVVGQNEDDVGVVFAKTDKSCKQRE